MPAFECLNSPSPDLTVSNPADNVTDILGSFTLKYRISEISTFFMSLFSHQQRLYHKATAQPSAATTVTSNNLPGSDVFMPHVIDDSLLSRSILFCRFAAAAYSNTDPRRIPGLNNGKLTCDTRLPLGFASNETDTQVLVCRWNDDVVVAFRGTELKLRDWLTDLTGSLVPCQNGTGQVHSGFQAALNSVYPQVIRSINDIVVAGKSRIFVCGHSLGGALSLLFADRYLREASRAGHTSIPLREVFTYGAPRVGDSDFSNNFRKTPIAANTFCWVDQEDPVTRVAPVSLHYRHAVQRQLCVDKDGWVRHTDIDGTVLPEEGDQSVLLQVQGLLQRASIAASLQASSHKLETSYLQHLLQAFQHSTHPQEPSFPA
jgi:triacylglycerol lipase